MTEKRYLRERVYRVEQKLGGMELWLRWPLPEGKEGLPEYLSIRLAGVVNGKRKVMQATLPQSCIPELLKLETQLKLQEIPEKTHLRFQGSSGADRLWFLEISYLAQGFLKPWEFRLYTAEGIDDLILSPPIRVQISTKTLENMLSALRCRWKPS